MRATTHRKRATIGAAVVAALAAIPLVTIATHDTAQAATAVAGDGTTSATAGASCWGIKQQVPASTDGVYWLNTPALERPTQFYCDMTTDGGGWVLVGRGRQGWSFAPTGQGSPTTLRTTPDGTGAFSPAALSSTTIASLLGGTTVDALPDGIRLERALNTNGTSRQSYSLFPTYKNWTWAFHAGQLLNKVKIGSSTYNGSNTWDTLDTPFGQTTNGLAGQQGTARMFTWAWSSHNNQKGFSFGNGVNGGSSSATNYLWNYTSENHPIPFTRVWIRPQIANGAAGFSPIPAAGYPAEPKPAALKSKSELAPWGVVGLDHTNETTIEPYNTNVLVLKTAADRTFVGGRFTGVQNGPTATQVAQPYLAAFDLDGNWISTFRPVVNGRVWDMIVAPDGSLVIAGDFTSVNGQPDTAGVAKLDPTTGAPVPGFKATFANTTSRLLVRGLALRNNTVYAAGSFNRFTGSNWNTITVSSAVSFDLATGAPGTWRPRLPGQAVRLRVSNDGTRVFIVGYFNYVNNDTNHAKFAITDIATGNPVPGIGTWTPSIGSGTKTYQQAVIDLPDGRVIVGGSEHNIQLWDRNRTQLIDSHTTKQGGDTQTIEVVGDTAYIGCHCGNWVYQGTNNWASPTGFRSIEPINLIGAFNTTTFQNDTTWYPSGLKGARGEGVWTTDKDSRGCLWVGGDLNRGAYSGNAATDWLGGFARFCAEDATAPTAPTNLTQTAAGSGVTLKWGASTDASGTVNYDVVRDDRVIANVWGTTYTDPEVTGAHRYTVRAVDARGNRSASPAPVNVAGPSPVIATPIALGSTWKYLDTGVAPAAGWTGNSFDDAAWPSAPARLGWGRPDVVSTIGATKPISVAFRRSFDVASAASVKKLELGLYEASGAVVYVNGVEAGRINMPAGTIAATTPAAAYVSGTTETSLKTITVPGSLLHDGTNTLAVEVHNVTAQSSKLFFDLQATAYGTGGDTTAPSAPVASALVGAGQVTVNWTASVDDIALGGYLLTRDGQPLAVAGPAATSFVDGTVDTSTAHTYVVSAFDSNGNIAASSPVNVAAVANPNLLAYGSSWKWFYAEGGPAADWAAPTFDDSGWVSGPAELGYGDADEKTVISTAPTPRPLTAYVRTTVNVTDPAAFASVLAQLIRDDGAVVYVNGVEVGRDNLPAGPIGFSTAASTVLSTRAQETTAVPFTIPSSAFVAGANVIAVEIHNSDRWSGDLSFDLKLIGQP